MFNQKLDTSHTDALLGFSVQPSPSHLDPEPNNIQCPILTNLPLASRNIVFAPVTFKVPSRLGPSIWKTFFAVNGECRGGTVSVVTYLALAAGIRQLSVNFGGYCYSLIYHEKHGGQGMRASCLQTFNWNSRGVPRLFLPQWLNWSGGRRSSEPGILLSLGVMAGKYNAETHACCCSDPDLPQHVLLDLPGSQLWSQAFSNPLSLPALLHILTRQTSILQGNSLLIHRNVAQPSNPHRASQDSHILL